MDLLKVLGLAKDFLSDYTVAFIAILQRPSAYFPPLESSSDSHLVLPNGEAYPHRGLRLNPKLLAFVILSIFIGHSIYSVTPRGTSALPIISSSAPSIVSTFVIIFLFWLFFSLAFFLACKALAGRGSLYETLSVSLQLFATLYVAGNFLALVWSLVTPAPGPGSGRTIFGWLLASPNLNLFIVPPWPVSAGTISSGVLASPNLNFFIVQFILMTLYSSLVARSLHGFGWPRQFAVSLVVSLPYIWPERWSLYPIGNSLYVASILAQYCIVPPVWRTSGLSIVSGDRVGHL